MTQRPRGPRRRPRTAIAPRTRAALSNPAPPARLARAVFATQVRGLLRDRRALFAAFVLPILLYPLMFLGNSWLERLSTRTLEARTVRAALDLRGAPEDAAARLRARLAEEAPIEIEDVDAGAVLPDAAAAPDAAPAVERAAALLADDHDVLLAALPADPGAPWSLATWYDGTRDVSNEARRRVRLATRDLHDELARERRLQLLGSDPARGLALTPIDVASPEDQSGALLGRWLPLLAVFVLLAGASHAALAAFAGEREAGTLETLLVQPVTSGSVVAAKFAAVLAVSVVSLVLNVGSVVVCLALGLGTLPGSGGADGFALGAGRMLGGAALFLPAAVLLCALLCLVCGRARTFREGQHLLLPLLLLAVVPTLPALQPDIELDALLAALPLTGPSLVLRDALRGSVSIPLAAWAMVASSGWAALALWRLARALDAEKLLQHGENEDEVGRRRTQSRTALRWAILVVFAVYLVGGWLQALDPVWGLALTLWGILPLAAWLSARGTARRARESIADVLSLRPPRVAHALGAVLIAPAAALGARHLFEWQQRALPMPHHFESVSLPLEILGQGVLLQVVLLALSPAICEELFFRGALLSGLRRDAPWWRVLAWQALLFGAVHASIYRFAPTALLGALLAAITLRARSVVPAVLLHGAYNALLVLSDTWPVLSNPHLAWAALLAPFLFLGRENPSAPELGARSNT